MVIDVAVIPDAQSRTTNAVSQSTSLLCCLNNKFVRPGANAISVREAAGTNELSIHRQIWGWPHAPNRRCTISAKNIEVNRLELRIPKHHVTV